jgi:two-component system C4-dicarboxylate transport sensor histidine kinase DctB
VIESWIAGGACAARLIAGAVPAACKAALPGRLAPRAGYPPPPLVWRASVPHCSRGHPVIGDKRSVLIQARWSSAVIPPRQPLRRVRGRIHTLATARTAALGVAWHAPCTVPLPITMSIPSTAASKPAPGVRVADGLLVWSLVAALMLAGGWAAFVASERAGHVSLADAAAQQLELMASGLDIEIARHEHLPSLMELDPEVLALLDSPLDAALRARVNRKLTNVNVRAGALSVMVMDPAGVVLAASNWFDPGSPLGGALSGSKHVTEALQSGQARAFVASTDRGAPECHFVQVIRHRGRVAGLAAVTTSLEAVESMWMALSAVSQSDRLLVVDENDIVIMSSTPAWRFKSLVPLPEERRTALAALRKYPVGRIEPLGLVTQRTLAHGTQLVRVPAGEPGQVQPGQAEGLYAAQERAMVRTGWRLMTLSDAQAVREQAQRGAVGGAALAGLVGMLALYLRQRRRGLASQRAAQAALQHAHEALQQAHGALERRVQERTAELNQANASLVVEVAERRRTEEQLRAAQADLVQAGKLATLGQMSAGITHEINQPLTALRALSDNTCQLLEIGRTNDVARNLRSIAGLTERIGRITAQLKSFAWKASVPPDPIPLAPTVSNALEMLRQRIEREAVDVQLALPPAARVACDAYRLEQVLLNLVSNALDAMKDAPRKQLRIDARVDGDRIHVAVADSGCGMPDAVMQRLFEPFFSTKSAGEGLGLGLVISNSIVRAFGGSLRARSGEGGTVFEFDLKLVDDAPATT